MSILPQTRAAARREKRFFPRILGFLILFRLLRL
jgi:hypothetical protein